MLLAQENRSKIYFYNLDGVRSLACLSVFVSHFYDYIDNYHIDNVVERWLIDHVFYNLGAIGVNFFFVLSGFLISYFLFTEKNTTNTIKLKIFYKKRILRIWPVFFIVVLTSFIFIPLICHYFQSSIFIDHFPYYLFFVNNFDRIYTHFTGINNDSLGVLWSIAVEEQFYLVWPLLIYFIKPKRLPLVFLIIILTSLIFRYFNVNNTDVLYYHTISLSADLVIGSLVAYIAVFNLPVFSFFKNINKFTTIIIYLLTILLIVNSKYLFSFTTLKVVQRLLFSSCFAFIIAEQNFNENSFFKFKNFAFFSKFAIITYGFYCYHTFCIMLLQKINLHFNVGQLSGLMFYSELILTFLLCYTASFFSYSLIEKKILNIGKSNS